MRFFSCLIGILINNVLHKEDKYYRTKCMFNLNSIKYVKNVMFLILLLLIAYKHKTYLNVSKRLNNRLSKTKQTIKYKTVSISVETRQNFLLF